MSDTTFVPGTPIVSTWLNDINDVAYDIIGNGTDVPVTKAEARDNLGLEIGVDIPSTTGTGASGTWAINVTGTAASPPAASTTVSGIIELATTAEAQTATDTTRALVPSTLKDAQIQLATQVNLSNQTSVDFTGIPSWAKRVTLLLLEISTNGTSNYLFQLGDSGGIEATSYMASGVLLTSAAAITGNTYSTGFGFPSAGAGNVISGAIVFEKFSGNNWICHGNLGFTGSPSAGVVGGRKTL
jgi:hypothetical protein